MAVDDVIREQHGEGLVSHQVARDQDGVAESQRFLLADVSYIEEPGDRAHLLAQFDLAPPRELVLELERDVEMVLNRVFAAPGDEDHHRDARGGHFFNRVLHQGLVHDGQHFLGLRLGGGEEARAQSSHGQNRFPNAHIRPQSPVFSHQFSVTRIMNYEMVNWEDNSSLFFHDLIRRICSPLFETSFTIRNSQFIIHNS